MMAQHRTIGIVYVVILLYAWMMLIRLLLSLVGILMLVLIHHLGLHSASIRTTVDPAMLRLIVILTVHPVCDTLNVRVRGWRRRAWLSFVVVVESSDGVWRSAVAIYVSRIRVLLEKVVPRALLWEAETISHSTTPSWFLRY